MIYGWALGIRLVGMSCKLQDLLQQTVGIHQSGVVRKPQALSFGWRGCGVPFLAGLALREILLPVVIIGLLVAADMETLNHALNCL